MPDEEGIVRASFVDAIPFCLPQPIRADLHDLAPAFFHFLSAQRRIPEGTHNHELQNSGLRFFGE